MSSVEDLDVLLDVVWRWRGRNLPSVKEPEIWLATQRNRETAIYPWYFPSTFEAIVPRMESD